MQYGTIGGGKVVLQVLVGVWYADRGFARSDLRVALVEVFGHGCHKGCNAFLEALVRGA
jgi:hypothetical protein